MSKINIKMISISIILLALIVLSFNHSFLSIGYLLTPKFIFAMPHKINTAHQQTFAISGSQLTNISYINQQLNITAITLISSKNKTQQSNNLSINTQCASFGYDNTTSTFVFKGIPQTIKALSYKVMFKYTPTKTGVYAFGVICETSQTGALDTALAHELAPLVTETSLRTEMGRNMLRLARPDASSEIVATIVSHLYERFDPQASQAA